MNNYNKWIDLGLKKGLEDIEVHILETTNLSLNVYEGKVDQNEISKSKKAIIKGIYNKKAAQVSVENLSDENINVMIDKLLDSAKNVTSKEPALIFEGSKEYVEVEEDLFDFSTIDPTTKVETLINIEKGIYENERSEERRVGKECRYKWWTYD